MTPTSVLPDHSATDVLSRPTLQNSGDGSGGNQGSRFPELLGRLMAHQPSDQPAKAQSPGPGDDGPEGVGQSPLPWKFRIGSGLALPGGAALAGTEAASSQPLAPGVTAEISTVAEHMQGDGPGIVSELLAGVQSGETGEDAGVGDAQANPLDLPVGMPARRMSTDAGALLGGTRLTAVAENSLPTAVASDAQDSVGMKGRRAGLPAEFAIAMASKAGRDDSTAATSVANGSGTVALSEPSVKFDGATGSNRQARDQEAPFVMGETKVAVLRTETHLPVTGHTLPMHQIAERIEAELGSVEIGEAGTDKASLWRANVTPVSAVKILHIQLQPADLGTVTVRMSLRRDVLEVQLDVSRQDTAHLMRQDREVLSKVLQSAGYVLDGLTVHVVEPDRTAPATQFANQGTQATAQSSIQTQPDWSQPDGRPPGMQRQGEGRHSSVQSDDAIDVVGDAIGARASNGGVYL